MMRVIDVKCKVCGKEQEVLVRGDDAHMPDDGCSCGNKDPQEFETIPTFAKAPTHSSWYVK